jgi:RNA polymerase sigma-B factor
MPKRAVINPENPSAVRERRTRALLANAATLPPSDARQVHDHVILLNRSLAQSLARQYRGRGIEDDDLEQVAMLALCKAVYSYRPQLDDTSFAAFAVPTITGELKRHFRDCGWLVRPTRSLQEVGQLVRNATPILTQRLQRQPSTSDLAEFLDVPAETVKEAQLAQGLYQGWSLDVPVGGATTTLGDTLADPQDTFAGVEAALTLGPALAELAPRERLVLQLRFLENMTQAKIGQRIGLSQMQVSRLLAGVLTRLRAQLESPRAA